MKEGTDSTGNQVTLSGKNGLTKKIIKKVMYYREAIANKTSAPHLPERSAHLVQI